MSRLSGVVHLVLVATLGLVCLWPAPVVAQVAAMLPVAPGPFGGDPQTQPSVDVSPATGASASAPVSGASSGAADASGVSASTEAGPAAHPPDPSSEIAPAISVLDASSAAAGSGASPATGDLASTSLLPGPGLEPGPLPLPGPVVSPPLGGSGLPTPQIGIPIGPGRISVPAVTSPTPSTASAPVLAGQASAATGEVQTQAQAGIPQWLKKVLSPGVFLAWLLELLPLLLQALLMALAALLSTMVLPPGGVVWRLPPELSYQLGGVGQAHAVLVQLADAALAVIVALVGFGHIAGPRAGLPVLPPRAVAPRLAVAVLVNHGSLAIGGWVIDLHNALLGAVTPSSLVGFDLGGWLQAGPSGLLLGVLYALVGLLLALGGWLRVALVDVLLVGAPVLAVLWVLPLTAEWGEWGLRLFGNLLAGQWLQVLALWLGGQMLLAPAPDLGTSLGKGFAALAVLLCALWLPGLLPAPRGLGGLQVLLGLALARHLFQGIGPERDRLERDFQRRKELERRYESEHPRPPLRVQVVSNRRSSS